MINCGMGGKKGAPDGADVSSQADRKTGTFARDDLLGPCGR